MSMPPVLVGTEDGVHSLDDGAVALPGHSIDHISVTADGMWMITDGGTVWHDHGDGWRSIAALTEHRAHCVMAAGERILVGAAEASLYELTDEDLRQVISFNGTPGRDTWFTPWGAPADTRSVAVDQSGTIYVNVHVGGIVRSIDGGTTWTNTVDIQSDVHQVVTGPDRPGHAYAASAWGLAVTTDGADTWEFVDDGLHSSYCRAVAVSVGWVFVSASEGHTGRHSALYRRPIAGGEFRRCTEGLPEWFSDNVNTFGLAARDQFVVAGDRSGTVYASTDDGDTWQVAAEGLPEVSCLAIA